MFGGLEVTESWNDPGKKGKDGHVILKISHEGDEPVRFPMFPFNHIYIYGYVWTMYEYYELWRIFVAPYAHL